MRLTLLLFLGGCSSAVPRDFEGAYDVRDAVAGCHEEDHGSTSASYGFTSPIDIERDAEGIHTIELPSIRCPVHANVVDGELVFADPSCVTADREERDIHGTGIWNDDELELDLESTEYWFPLPEYWPDGIEWECWHRYVLAPTS